MVTLLKRFNKLALYTLSIREMPVFFSHFHKFLETPINYGVRPRLVPANAYHEPSDHVP